MPSAPDVHPGSLRSELRATLALAAPAVAQSLLQTLVFLADRFFLGRFSADALAAMQIAGPLTWTLQSVFGAFATGTLALVGRAVGARDPALAGRALRASVGIAVLLGAAVGLAGTLGLHALVGALAGAASSPVREAAIGYLGVVLPAMPVLFVAMVCTTALQASGDTRTPLAIALVTNAVNLGLNGLLIFGNLGCPRLGARGAAIANVTALSVEMLLGLAALADVRRPASLRGAPWTGTVAALRRLAAVSTGAFAERAIYHAGYLVFVRITNGLGAAPMAAHQALLSMESVSFLSADGFGVAAGARAAQRLGAGDAVGARRAGWIATGASTAIVGVVAMALWACGSPSTEISSKGAFFFCRSSFVAEQ